MSTQDKRYVILELSDAKALADFVNKSRDAVPRALAPVIQRIVAETGADIPDIVRQLRGLDFCHACVVEGQQQYCECPSAQSPGRRLSRLVDRADGKPGYEEPNAETSPLPRTVENVTRTCSTGRPRSRCIPRSRASASDGSHARYR